MNSRGGETRDGGVKVGQILLERRGLNGIRKECVTGKVQVRLVRGERDETRVVMWKGDDDWGCMKKRKEARWKEGRRRASQWWCHHDHIQMDVGVFNPKQISHLKMELFTLPSSHTRTHVLPGELPQYCCVMKKKKKENAEMKGNKRRLRRTRSPQTESCFY